MGCYNSKEKENLVHSDKSCTRIGDFSKKHRRIVQEMWSKSKPGAKKFGISVFLRLFDEVPETQDLFYDFKNLKDQDELLQSLEELDHVAKVMNAFGNCIELLDDDNQFVSTVHRIGVVHRKIGITIGHLEVFGKLVIEKLSQTYDSTWTINHEKAWTAYLGLLTAYFGAGLHGK